MRVVGLSGYARVGKDTVASIMKEFGWERRAFADKLKLSVHELNPIVEYDAAHDRYVYFQDTLAEYGPEGAKSFPEVRRLLQRFGTEVGRNLYGENFWVEQALSNLDDDGLYVFTDCRFVNEADAIRQLGGEVWRVHRPGYGPVNNHPSETSLDDYGFDQHIVNSAGLPNLEQRVKSLCLALV